MAVEDIVAEIRRQERIINAAQKEKERLYDRLLSCDDEDYELISVKEAAKKLSVSLSTVYEMVRSGRIKAKYIGSAIRVYKSEVMAIDDKYQAS